MRNKSNTLYLLVALSMCGLAATSLGLSMNCAGVFFTPIAEEFGFLRGDIAMTSTITLFVSALSAIVVPRILTRNNLKKILFFGVILTGGSTLLLAYSTKLWQFYLFSGIRGCGCGCFTLVTVSLVINKWFIAKNGLVTSIAMSFSGICGALGSPIFTRLIEGSGWRFAYMVCAVCSVLFCLPALLLPYTLDPADIGYTPYGQKADPGGAPDQSSAAQATSVGLPLVIMLLLLGGLGSSLTSYTQHLPGVSSAFGYASTVGALALSFALTGNIISKLSIGILTDRLGPVKAYVFSICVSLAGTLIMALLHLPAGLLCGAFFHGFIYAAGIGLSFLSRYYVGDQQYGKVFPWINLTGSICASITLSVYGYIYDFTGGYTLAFLINTIILITVLVLVFLLSRCHKRLRPTC